jgi:hypothetical protein
LGDKTGKISDEEQRRIKSLIEREKREKKRGWESPIPGLAGIKSKFSLVTTSVANIMGGVSFFSSVVLVFPFVTHCRTSHVHI